MCLSILRALPLSLACCLGLLMSCTPPAHAQPSDPDLQILRQEQREQRRAPVGCIAAGAGHRIVGDAGREIDGGHCLAG